jgi:hypothetical protein
MKWDRETKPEVPAQPEIEPAPELLPPVVIETELTIQPEPVIEPEPEPVFEPEPVNTADTEIELTAGYGVGNYTDVTYVTTALPIVQQPPAQIQPEPEPVIPEPVIEPALPYIEPVIRLLADTVPSEIETDGVTQRVIKYHPSEGYVNHEGKRTSIEALRGSDPSLLLSPDEPKNMILFGTEFPKFARSGDIYTRTDSLPHRVFKFNGSKWVEMKREQTSVYLQNIPYLQLLISKIESGEYDPELLTANEEESIAHYLSADK